MEPLDLPPDRQAALDVGFDACAHDKGESARRCVPEIVRI